MTSSARVLSTIVLAFVLIQLFTNGAMVEANYRKPPFNGSIFGKRAAGNNNNGEYFHTFSLFHLILIISFLSKVDYEVGGKALSSMCEIALEACQSWFSQDSNK